MKLHLETLDRHTSFRPGDTVEGVAGWEPGPGEDPPDRVEVRLFWHTAGKGDRDVGVVDTVSFDAPAPTDAQVYRLALPAAGPYSFSGKLISLTWSIELVVMAGGNEHVERLDLTVSPTGEEVRL